MTPLGQDSPPPPRGLGPLVAMVLAVVVAATVLAQVDSPSGIPPPPTTAPQEPALRGTFEEWPTFALIWEVSADGLGLNPCQDRVGSPDCRVLLSWDGPGRWALSYSEGEVFGPSHPQDLGWRGIRYTIRGGTVQHVLEGTSPVFPMVCPSLLESARDDPTVAVEQGDSPYGSILAFSRGETSARCLEPWGIPLSFSNEGVTWEASHLRFPGAITDNALGIDAVRGELFSLPAGSCTEETGVAFSSSPAGQWLLSLMGQRPALPAGSGVWLELAPGREALAWVTAESSAPLPGMRRREVSGVFLHEALDPVQTVTFEAGGVRIWLILLGPMARIPQAVEGVMARLGATALELAGAAGRRPYEGPDPAGRAAFGPGIQALEPGRLMLPEWIRMDPQSPGLSFGEEGARVQASPLPLPGFDVWQVGSVLPDGSPVLVADRGDEVMVMAGGANLLVPGASKDRLSDISDLARTVATQAARCPWLGMPAQPPGP